MTVTQRLEKLSERVLSWSAYKALRGYNKDSSKLDSIVRELDRIIKELNEA